MLIKKIDSEIFNVSAKIGLLSGVKKDEIDFMWASLLSYETYNKYRTISKKRIEEMRNDPDVISGKITENNILTLGEKYALMTDDEKKKQDEIKKAERKIYLNECLKRIEITNDDDVEIYSDHEEINDFLESEDCCFQLREWLFLEIVRFNACLE